jgi:hypothetical protein
MTDSMHELPVAEVYRSIEIYGLQSTERIAAAKREIDVVIKMTAPRQLAAFACDPSRAPEARLLAKNKALASLEQRQRRGIDVDRLHASTAGIERICSRLGRLMGLRNSGYPEAGGWPREWAPPLGLCGAERPWPAERRG